MDLSLEQKVKLLLNSGISGDKVAERTNLTKGTFYNLKNGVTEIDKIRFATIKQLANLYDEIQEEKILKNDGKDYIEFINVLESIEINHNKSFSDKKHQKKFDELIKQEIKSVISDPITIANLYTNYKETSLIK